MLAPRPLSPAVIVLTLSLLLGIQPITTDLYLPALPQLTADFGAPMAAAQLTLSALLACFGLGQLVLGPVADRFGRRPVLLVGVSLYIVAGIASATAPSIGWLIAARALQGAGMAAAVMCGRAMVRDLYEPHDGMRVMSQALSGLGIIALAAPVVGGLIAASFGWRMALLATAVFGAGTLALLALRVPETARNLNPEATRIGPLIATYWRIARNPTFLAWSLLVTATYAGIYAFLGGSTFVYVNEMGASRRVVGLLIALASVSYLVGTIVCRRWLVSLGARGAVRRAALLTAAAAALHAGFALQDAHTLWTLSLAQVLYGFGHGIHQPCGQAGVVGPFPREAGAASALAGFMLALGAFLMGGWLGATLDGGVRSYSLTIAGMALLTSIIAWTLVQRHGDPQVARTAMAAG